MSVALEICRMAEEHAAGSGAGAVTALGIDVGDDCGLEAANLEFCLETLLAMPPFAGARPLVTRCPGDVLRLSYLEVDDDRPRD